MMKRIGTLGLVLGIIVALIGCAPKTTPTPTVTPVVTPAPAATVTPQLNGTATPGVTPGETTPDGTPGTTTPGATGTAVIPNFKEGTAVMTTDIPEIQKAFEEKYKDYTIVSVTHALRDNAQVYRIEYKDKDGKTEEIFIHPNGTWYDNNASTVTSSDNVE